MTTALTFNSVTLSPVQHQGSLWIRATELARALGYKQENSVSRLYRNNAEEFTPDMTQVIEIAAESRNGSLGNMGDGRTRIFSPRGCHLIAMFARTAVAKQFRRWVLDVLDKVCAPESAPRELPPMDAPITPDQQCTLQAIVKAKIEALPEAERKGRGLYPQVWSRFNNHFRLARYAQLPQSRMSEAVAFLTQMEITVPALPLSRPLTRPALPAPAGNRALPYRKLRDIIKAIEQVHTDCVFVNAPKTYRMGDNPAAERYAIQAEMYRVCMAALRSAQAALRASALIGEWA